MIDRREKLVMQALWSHGRLSRWELHEATGLSPNGVGTLVDGLIRAGLVRECAPEAAKMGRPRVPLEIDPTNRRMIGLALGPGRVDIAEVNLTGAMVGALVSKNVQEPAALIQSAAGLLNETIHRQSTHARTIGVGVSITGFIDAEEKKVLFSSALPQQPVESLEPIFAAADETPAVLGNDMHALAARWLLTHRAEQRQDVLLVWFTDGRLGSSLLIDGRPNRGCAVGANELGHTRFVVDTARCFCGQLGCLERIVSSDFIARNEHAKLDSNGNVAIDNPAIGATQLPSLLEDRAAQFQRIGDDRALDEMLKYLSIALSNSVNMLRLDRLVIVSPLIRSEPFARALVQSTRELILPGMSDRVHIDRWDQPSSEPAENAAWLAMAELLYGGWHMAEGGEKLKVGSW